MTAMHTVPTASLTGRSCRVPARLALRAVLCAALVLCPALAFAEGQSKAKEATPVTRAVNQAERQRLPFADKQDFADAERGFLAPLPGGVVTGDQGRIVWDLRDFAFLEAGDAPATVNPSLWRMAQLNMKAGLFKVTDGLYQVRGLDLSNMTIIEGETGVIIIDPLTSVATAAAALKLYRDNVPGAKDRPVKALIYTHPHVDHYGGASGVVSEDDVRQGGIPVLAPEGFLREAVSENVLAGNVMSRRALYMYGRLLPISEKGRVDAGLGKGTPVGGGSSLIPPTDSIRATGETRTLDGVEIIFQMTPDTEAPAEMLLYFPKFKALCAAENATHTLHNLYTLRGAKVRDADQWQRALDEAIDLFGDRAEVVFAQHHWPIWGADRVRGFLAAQRDGYKFIHDQTLRLANQGYTPEEISEKLRFPASLDRLWHLRGYYGTLRHDVKAVYQLYLGWFDGHPANLNPLPGREAARRYVRYMGGGEAMLEKARDDYAKGEYRWVAEVLKHLVFAEPDNQAARNLQADALEQLGYQAESAPWRGFYLTGAQELRRSAAVKPQAQFKSSANPEVARNMTPEMQLDYLAVRLNADRTEGKSARFNWTLPSGQVYALTVENSVLLYKKDAPHKTPDSVFSLSGEALLALVDSGTDPAGYFRNHPAALQGDKDKAREFFSLFDSFALFFPIVDREDLR